MVSMLMAVMTGKDETMDAKEDENSSANRCAAWVLLERFFGNDAKDSPSAGTQRSTAVTADDPFRALHQMLMSLSGWRIEGQAALSVTLCRGHGTRQ